MLKIKIQLRNKVFFRDTSCPVEYLDDLTFVPGTINLLYSCTVCQKYINNFENIFFT